MQPEQVRAALNEQGVPRRDVGLPGDSTNLRQGAINVVALEPGFEVRSEEYGLHEVLARTSTLDEAVDYVLERLGRALPRKLARRDSDLAASRREMERLADHVRAFLTEKPGTTPTLNLWDGVVVDRFGPLDGFLLWPEGVPFAQRAQPPDTLEPSLPELGYTVFGVARDLQVKAKITAPWFGQPGGALCFKIDSPGKTVRDLVLDGTLVRLQIVED